jgi:hypothetical protein
LPVRRHACNAYLPWLAGFALDLDADRQGAASSSALVRRCWLMRTRTTSTFGDEGERQLVGQPGIDGATRLDVRAQFVGGLVGHPLRPLQGAQRKYAAAAALEFRLQREGAGEPAGTSRP